MEIGTAAEGERAPEFLPVARPTPTLELACGSCGYGVIVRRAPAVCPMCGEHAWEPPLWRPFGRRFSRPTEPAA
jgi:rubrerythrin